LLLLQVISHRRHYASSLCPHKFTPLLPTPQGITSGLLAVARSSLFVTGGGGIGELMERAIDRYPHVFKYRKNYIPEDTRCSYNRENRANRDCAREKECRSKSKSVPLIANVHYRFAGIVSVSSHRSRALRDRSSTIYPAAFIHRSHPKFPVPSVKRREINRDKRKRERERERERESEEERG